ncbi:MAG TPA: ATP-binding cassette domain-containing protein, partial [Pseudomonadales bacterium]|nr:ATP-binding cassette domain-containing protein [Pseudomonadales bacterium]
MSSLGDAAQNRQPVIQCDSVYKIFGENAKKLLQSSKGNVDAKVFQEAGCIVGVNNASFEVHKGQMLVVMGLSGSGKSTLLRCISRLTDATAGNIFIDGEDLLAMSNKKLIELRRNKMGMVFQSFALLPHRTVLENIAFPLQIKGSSTQDSMKRAKDMVDLVGLDGRENYFPRELSGGQQQRVGIARSLAVEPDIWFLDEPFSALDPLIRKEMQDEFLRLQGVLNKTILFVTHDFDEALRLADRIAIMKEGVIEQLDTPANIVLSPATEYVRKFTEDVPREKVLKIESVM